VLVTPATLAKTERVLSRARIRARFEALPSAEDISRNQDERIFEAVTGWSEDASARPDERAWTLAKRIAREADPARAIAALVMRARRSGGPEPREITPIAPQRREANGRPAPRHDARQRRHQEPVEAPRRDRPERQPQRGAAWVAFRVAFGEAQGADARRLLPMVCRRGGIRGSDVGSIRVERSYSIVDVAAPVADAFERAAAEPDPRDPGITIVRSLERSNPPHPLGGERRLRRAPRPQGRPKTDRRR
jgi:ATP-dependent RNA helicase DeaD